MQKYWHIGLITLVLLLGIAPLLAPLLSEDFRYCETHQGQHAAEPHNEKGAAVISVPLRKPSGLSLHLHCASVVADQNSASISAIGATLMYFVTVALGLIAWRQYTTTRAQLRAYVFVTQHENSPITVAEGIVSANLVMKNTGNTPAYDVGHITHMRILPYPECGEFDPVRKPRVCTVLPPGQGVLLAAKLPVTAEQAAAVNAETGRLYIWGRVDYADAFGVIHHTNFRYMIGGIKTRHDGSVEACHGGNHAD